MVFFNTILKLKEVIMKSPIAPCGMNCSVCVGFMRDKNQCPGCNAQENGKPKYCRTCVIKYCDQLNNGNKKFCYQCSSYPCRRLRQLDKRYRTKYGMSMLENLDNIKISGISSFIKQEKKRWECPVCKSTLSVHRNKCLHCGTPPILQHYDIILTK
jgi:hypothetical protein